MAPEPSTVLFENAPRALRRGPLRAFAADLSLRVGGKRPFACVIANDRALRRLNRDFLGKDYATDVLSFPSGAASGPLGDIAISVDRAAAQARQFRHSLATELRILMLHGVLHLRGYDHELDEGKMRRAEERWRREFELPVGLISRTSGGGNAP
ncbi:MAG: rRNA maturation RNase YbeY [Bryobacteraceae bacterium]